MTVVIPAAVSEAAPYADFIDLRTAVIETVRNAGITDIFTRLTKTAEARFNRELRLREQITSDTVTVTGGVGPLPDDFLEMIGVFDENGGEFVAQPIQAVQSRHFSFYSLDGSDLIANDRDYTVQYYARIPTITDSMIGTNWLLIKHPDVYLYGVAVEAAKHLRDDALPVLTGLRDGAISEARGDDIRARYSRARVRVQGPVP